MRAENNDLLPNPTTLNVPFFLMGNQTVKGKIEIYIF